MNVSLSDFTEANLPACSARFLWAAVSLSDALVHAILYSCQCTIGLVDTSTGSRRSYTASEKLKVIKYAEAHGNRAAGREFDPCIMRTPTFTEMFWLKKCAL